MDFFFVRKLKNSLESRKIYSKKKINAMKISGLIKDQGKIQDRNACIFVKTKFYCRQKCFYKKMSIDI